VGVLVLASCLFGGLAHAVDPPATSTAPPPVVVAAPPAPKPVRQVKEVVLPAATPAEGLPVIKYRYAPAGFPADPAPASTEHVTEALHPGKRLAVYDRPGGKARAYLPPHIRGVPVIVPIVARQPGWVAVLLPSVNRRIGWVPARGWTTRPLRDQLVVRRGTHELEWLRDGVRQKAWTVAIGSKRTPTPLGRTFVLGRTGTHGSVYAGLDALVLGAVPDDRESVAPGLRDAHTGIHAWHRASAFGRSVSNGCVRMPPAAQSELLREIAPGSLVVVLD
jgi:lipoprotein-anchoring transpeptidase ErfK/SrfK